MGLRHLLGRNAGRGPSVVFGVRLRSRASARDWDNVCRNLWRTLINLSAQTDNDIKIVLACHEVPRFLNEDDKFSHVEVVDVSGEYPPPATAEESQSDKFYKKQAIGVRARSVMDKESFYYVNVDADDLIERDLARVIKKSKNKSGFFFERGYMVDARERRVAALNRKQKPLYKTCGTCYAIYMGVSDLPRDLGDVDNYFNSIGNHRKIKGHIGKNGKPLTSFKRYAAVYLVNHGDNVWEMRNDARKNTYIDRCCLGGEEKIVELSQKFPGLAL